METLQVRYQQCTQLLRLVGEMQEIRDLGQRDEHACRGLLRILGGEAAIMALIKDFRPGGAASPAGSTNAGLDEAVWAGVRQWHLQNGLNGDPAIARSMERLPPDSTEPLTSTRQELTRDRDWYRSEYAQRLRSFGLEPSLYSFARGKDESSTADGIGILRSWGSRPFDREDRDLLRLFHSHWPGLPRAPLPAEEEDGDDSALSPRERETFRHLLAGRSFKEVADRMGLSFHTARQYGKSVYRKLGVHSHAQLLAVCGERAPRAATPDAS